MARHTHTFTQADIVTLNSLSTAIQLFPFFTMFPIWSGGGSSTFLNNLQNAILPTCSFTISFAMFIMCSQRKAAGKKEVGSLRTGLRMVSPFPMVGVPL
ncbi:hypothetical protein GCK32_002209 [Trichostrongylus colubriformis]|uniref:Uncharacterized protein n=1 Tax=Trichostrongylus colubriformis TaxID=6319 RepID=A0AAN8FZ87_TRICO